MHEAENDTKQHLVTIHAPTASGSLPVDHPVGSFASDTGTPNVALSSAMRLVLSRGTHVLALVLVACGGSEIRDESIDTAGSATNPTTGRDDTSSAGSVGPSSTSTGVAETGMVDGTTSTGGGPIFDVPAGETDGPNPGSCEDALELGTTVGCQFFAVDLDQAQFFEGQQFAVVVSNVQTALTAEVVVEEKQAGAWVVSTDPCR